MCADQESSDERSTPKYLKVSTCSRGVSFSISCGGWAEFLFLEMIINLHLFGLSVRLLQLTQSLMRTISDCRCLKFSGNFTGLYSKISSAYRLSMLPSFDFLCHRIESTQSIVVVVSPPSCPQISEAYVVRRGTSGRDNALKSCLWLPVLRSQ